MVQDLLPKPLRVAIVGGGPAGLGSAIALSSLPNVEVSLFEQARELREIGAGIRIGYNCWRVLELLGAADGVKGHLKTTVLHRNGVTGQLLASTSPTGPLRYQPRRVRRTRLQSALVAKVPAGIIQLNKRLISLEKLENGKVQLVFQDGTDAIADLVVGADGIRSVVRDSIFPDHKIKFTGTTIWRTLVPITKVAHIPDLIPSTTWWHGTAGHIYTSPVDDPDETVDGEADDRMFEISCRNLVDPATAALQGKRFSWGIPATNERVLSHFEDYDPRVQAALAQVSEGQWKEFAAFAGPRLERLTAWDSVVLLGDASHPLSGAFGSGAAFALEDAWILAQAIQFTARESSESEPLAKALEIFDAIRSPYYLRMYEYLDAQKQKTQEAAARAAPDRSFHDTLKVKLGSLGGEEALPWIYRNDIQDVWEKFLQGRTEASDGADARSEN